MPAAGDRSSAGDSLETLLLHACLKSRAVAGDLALTILEAQVARGTLDSEACRHALEVCSTSGAWREALGLLGHLEHLGERGGAEFGHAIRACAAGGQHEQMWQLAATAEAEAGPPDMPTLTAMMQACRQSKDGAGAEALWRRMCAAMSTPPEADGLSAFLLLCAEQRQWQRAHALLGEAKRAGLAPSLKHWNARLPAASRDPRTSRGQRRARCSRGGAPCRRRWRSRRVCARVRWPTRSACWSRCRTRRA